jgi:REP element-mobilizing transposase RayT
MARRPRIQFAGALYHIINRGNYRRDIFETEGAAQAFEKCLFEACEKSGWRLHAYVIMRNHFHLAVETPQGNLVKGMHWLQGTFATRFNRFRSEQGYLFQRRYQAILVEPGPTLSYVVNYIHLNPVKCGLLTVDRMDEYRWCSFRRFVQKNRPAFLVCEEWLAELGRFSDSRAGWRSYRDYLSWLITDKPEQKNQAFEQMTRGWALGSKEFRVDLIKAHKENLENGQSKGAGAQFSIFPRPEDG